MNIKSLKFCSIIALLLLLMIAAEVIEASEIPASVATIKADIGISGGKTLAAGTVVNIISQDNDWYEIEFQGERHFVHQNWLIINLTSNPTGAAVAAAAPAASMSASELNGEILYELGISGGITISAATRVTVIDRQAEWYNVKFNGQSFKIHASNLKVTGNVPVVPPPQLQRIRQDTESSGPSGPSEPSVSALTKPGVVSAASRVTEPARATESVKLTEPAKITTSTVQPDFSSAVELPLMPPPPSPELQPPAGAVQLAFVFLSGQDFDITVNGGLIRRGSGFSYTFDNNGVTAGVKVVAVSGNFKTLQINPQHIRLPGLNNDGFGAFAYKVVNRDINSNLFAINAQHNSNINFWGNPCPKSPLGIIVSRSGNTVTGIKCPDPLFYMGYRENCEIDSRDFHPQWSINRKIAISFINYGENTPNPAAGFEQPWQP